MTDICPRALLDTAPDAFVVVQRDGTLVLVNRQAEALFGRPRSELIGQPLEALIPHRLRGTHLGHVARYFANPTGRPMGSGIRLVGLHADGSEIPIEVSLSPVHTSDGIVVSAAIRDVTDRLRVEEELRGARTQAEAGSRAKSEFLASMSHELRTPLNAILGFAQLLQRDRKEPMSTRQLERVEHILRGGEHLLRLIDDVLDLARIESGRLSTAIEPVAVAEVVGEAVSSLSEMAARGTVHLRVAPIGEACRVRADRTRLVQILINFGSNAVKYNRPGGTVVFSATERGPVVRIAVEDTGIGIAADKQELLFQPFQRAGQETGPIEGTGIGLALSRRLAGLFGGSVGFVSTLGVGSTFWVDVPAHAGSAGEA